jgi:hypothetical protein
MWRIFLSSLLKLRLSKPGTLPNEFLAQHTGFLPVDLAGDFVLMWDYTGKEVVE